MREELNSLKEKDTWTLVPRPQNVKVVKNRWVLAKKEDGRYKARLVAKGFTQQYGVDYFETYSPVLRSSSVRLLLSFAHAHRMHVHHLDVKNAYINSPLNETIFMEQPYMFEDYDRRQVVCRLNKSLYGLKQAAKCWNLKLIELLSSIGLHQLETEPCIVVNHDQTLIVGFYVDDMLILSKNIDLIKEFKTKFSKLAQTTDKGEMSHFVGLQVRRDEHSIRLCQTKYIESLLEQQELCNSNNLSITIR